jgi:hypothetical protein
MRQRMLSTASSPPAGLHFVDSSSITSNNALSNILGNISHTLLRKAE